jgi:hypothetical protein
LAFRGQEGPTGNGKKLRNAASAERVEILREGDQGRSGGAAGKKREVEGKPKTEPTFPESGGTGGFGRRKRERPPEELARREAMRDLKGSPGKKRMVGKSGSPDGERADGTITGLPEGCLRMVAGLPERRPTDGSRACLAEV